MLGGAGTGKTVAAVHRARRLAREALQSEGGRVLFTTFTVNLAEDIRANLAKLCTDEEMGRIEVINLDRWVSHFLKARGYELKYLFDDDLRREFWGRAMTYRPEGLDLPDSFFTEEWDKVIQPQEISTEREYFKADRRGRGTPLDRKVRKALWPVFEEYRAILAEQGYCEPDDAMRDARRLLETGGERLPYCAVVVDEAQDLGPLAFRLIRQMVPPERTIFLLWGTPTRGFTRADGAVPVRHRGAWPEPEAEDKLPHHRGDEAVGAGAAEGEELRRPGRRHGQPGGVPLPAEGAAP